MELFSKIHTTPYYNDTILLNLLTKITTLKENYDKVSVYYPYVIKEGERPDTIAYDYYGSSTYAWLILLSNGIYDVYTQWPLSSREFYDYLKAKYGYVYELMSEIAHYKYVGITNESQEEIDRKNYIMSKKTFELLPVDEKTGWAPVYIYDEENINNEKKRSIKLLSNEYRDLVDRELNGIFK